MQSSSATRMHISYVKEAEFVLVFCMPAPYDWDFRVIL